MCKGTWSPGASGQLGMPRSQHEVWKSRWEEEVTGVRLCTDYPLQLEWPHIEVSSLAKVKISFKKVAALNYSQNPGNVKGGIKTPSQLCVLLV